MICSLISVAEVVGESCHADQAIGTWKLYLKRTGYVYEPWHWVPGESGCCGADWFVGILAHRAEGRCSSSSGRGGRTTGRTFWAIVRSTSLFVRSSQRFWKQRLLGKVMALLYHRVAPAVNTGSVEAGPTITPARNFSEISGSPRHRRAFSQFLGLAPRRLPFEPRVCGDHHL